MFSFDNKNTNKECVNGEKINFVWFIVNKIIINPSYGFCLQ